MSENAEYCFYMNQFDWENGKIGAVDELLLQNFSRDLIGYIDDSDNILHFGMKTRNSDELKLDFNSEKYDENYMVIQAFDVYHFGEKCYHISNEQMGISGITYTDFASEDGYEYRDEDADCTDHGHGAAKHRLRSLRYQRQRPSSSILLVRCQHRHRIDVGMHPDFLEKGYV